MVGIVSKWYLIDPYQLYWPNQPKNCLKEIFQNAKNLTLAVERVIVLKSERLSARPLLLLLTYHCSCPPITAPAHPFCRGPLYFSDFFEGYHTHAGKIDF